MTTRVGVVTFIGTILLWVMSPNTRAEAYGSGWYGELQLSYGHEDNISRSFLSIDEVSDDISSFSIGGGHSQKIDNNAQLVFYGYVTYSVHDEYGDLDNIASSLGGSYTYQPSPAYDSIWYNGDVSVTYFVYDNSDAREGLLADVDLSVNKRLGTGMTGHLGYRYADFIFVGKSKAEEKRDAVFNTATHEVYIGIDYELQPAVYAYGEYAFRHGDANSNNSSAAGLVEYDAETIDRVFDDCAPSDFRCQPRYSGRTVSDTHRLNIGVVFPIKTVNVDISGIYYDAEGDNGKKYKDWFLSVGLIWNF